MHKSEQGGDVGDEMEVGDGSVRRNLCVGLSPGRGRGEGREEELDMGLLGHEVQAGMDAGDADEVKASG